MKLTLLAESRSCRVSEASQGMFSFIPLKTRVRSRIIQRFQFSAKIRPSYLKHSTLALKNAVAENGGRGA